MTSVPGPLRGVFRPPGDKSISHRALLLGALAQGPCVVSGRLRAGDVDHTVSALRALGVRVDETGERLTVYGRGGRFDRPKSPLDAGSSATTARLLAGILARCPAPITLTGSASLRTRPMARVFEPLACMGLQWTAVGDADRLPIEMVGGPLRGGDFALPVASAQVASALLFAGLAAVGRTRVTVPRPVRDHTMRLFRHAGLEVQTPSTCTVVLPGTQSVAPFSLRLVGDASSAAFVAVAAAIVPGSDVEICGVGLNPGRLGWVDVLRRMGTAVDVSQEGDWGGEPVGRIRVRYRTLNGTAIEPSEVPRLIDELPVLAMAAAVAEGETRLSGAAELRVKESDRIESICAGLAALGIDSRPEHDGYVIAGRPDGVDGGQVDAMGDHRIAMSFSVLGLRAGRPVQIRGAQTMRDSFPGFRAALGHLQP